MKKTIASIIVMGLLLIPTMATATPFIVNNMPEENLHGENSNYILEKSGPLSVAEWTIIAYMDGDNDIEDFVIDRFLQMAQVGSTDDVNIIAQLDRAPGLETRYGDWTSTKRYYIAQGMVPDNSSAIMDIGEANMADPETLIDFTTWATNNYPANRYCLILLDHGGGWYGVCSDESSSGHDVLETCELRTALSTITSNGENPIDLICFDACTMAMMEVAYEIAPYASYMTASEWSINADVNYGIQYDETFTCLTENPSMPPETLGAIFVNNFNDNALSTIDLGLANNLKDAVSDLATSLQVGEYLDEILNVIDDVFEFDFHFADLYHFAQLVQNYIDDFEIDAKAQIVMDQINSTVTSEKHWSGFGNSHGIAIYIITKQSHRFLIYNPEYSYILYAQDSQWDEFLLWYIGLVNTNHPETPEITGPNSGEIGTSYEYDFQIVDPDSDYMYFYVDWGDGTNSGWMGPYGHPCPQNPPYLSRITLNHTWTEKGTYQVRAKAKDIFDLESDWRTLTVTMPLDLPGSHQSSPTPQTQPSTQPSSEPISKTTTQTTIGSTTLLGKTTSK